MEKKLNNKTPVRKKRSPSRAVPAAPATQADILGQARALVDERLETLGDEHLKRLVALERAACAVNTGEQA